MCWWLCWRADVVMGCVFNSVLIIWCVEVTCTVVTTTETHTQTKIHPHRSVDFHDLRENFTCRSNTIFSTSRLKNRREIILVIHCEFPRTPSRSNDRRCAGKDSSTGRRKSLKFPSMLSWTTWRVKLVRYFKQCKCCVSGDDDGSRNCLRQRLVKLDRSWDNTRSKSTTVAYGRNKLVKLGNISGRFMGAACGININLMVCMSWHDWSWSSRSEAASKKSWKV